MNDICGVQWISGELRASAAALEWLQKAADGDLNDTHNIPELLPHVLDDGTIDMNWHGMGAAEGAEDGTLVEFLSHTIGDAEFALVDEYGQDFLGVRVRNGETTFHVVTLVLGFEIKRDEI